MEQGHGTALRILCWELHCFFARLGKGDSPKQGPSSFYHCVFMQAPFCFGCLKLAAHEKQLQTQNCRQVPTRRR